MCLTIRDKRDSGAWWCVRCEQSFRSKWTRIGVRAQHQAAAEKIEFSPTCACVRAAYGMPSADWLAVRWYWCERTPLVHDGDGEKSVFLPVDGVRGQIERQRGGRGAGRPPGRPAAPGGHRLGGGQPVDMVAAAFWWETVGFLKPAGAGRVAPLADGRETGGRAHTGVRRAWV